MVLLACAGCQAPAQTPVERLQEAGQEAAALLGQVRVLSQEGKYAQGMALADSLVQRAPALPEAYYERGLLLIQLHQLDDADLDLERAVTLDPHHRGGWYQRGHVAFEQRNYREAIARYDRQRAVIESSPGDLRDFYKQVDQTALPQIWLQIGRSYELMNVADSATWAYRHALALDSTHAQAHGWVGELLKQEGELDAALDHSRKAMYYSGGHPDFAYQLGLIYFERGALEEAIPLFDRVVKQQPWNASAHYNLGRSLVGMGRSEEGQAHLNRVDPLQDLDQSIEYARAAVSQFPDEPARWRQLARLLDQAGRVQEQQQVLHVIQGLRAYKQSVDSSPAPVQP